MSTDKQKNPPRFLINDDGLVAGYDELGGQPSFDIFDAAEWSGTELEAKAIAARIALTWNSHDDLLEALDRLYHAVAALDLEDEGLILAAAWEGAEAAIKQARGQSNDQ